MNLPFFSSFVPTIAASYSERLIRDPAIELEASFLLRNGIEGFGREVQRNHFAQNRIRIAAWERKILPTDLVN